MSNHDNYDNQLLKAVQSIAKSLEKMVREPRVEFAQDRIVQCICPNCHTTFCAELPEGQKVTNEWEEIYGNREEN